MKKINNKKNEKGITLIALVVTIVILIILASVGISMSLTNTGLFSRAKQARNDYSDATNSEYEIAQQYSNFIASYDTVIRAEDVEFEPEDKSWNVHNVKEALDYLYGE